ncbi:MAG: putative ATP-dependent DNA helicase [Prokaryotic dsDNA virus sp.]|jgi:exodeoxyribonuclease-5|nr:MAG: putative ATP-dependent DNA helicase [Prokaryotic dsDNA virus sp.]|tara:strand:- start:38356 stop:39591 length:1236 start_codon:yes stop_codon:yes gene_type:complete
MLWSPQQEDALSQVSRWLKSGNEQVFHLFGYAGSGKTTMAKDIASKVNGRVIFAAFTGKAAYVLQTKGCDGATTIHSLIYNSRDKGTKTLKEMETQLKTLIDELREDGMSQSAIDIHPRVRDLTIQIKAEREDVQRPFFVLNEESEIRSAKLVIIDECSMVDAKMGEDLLSFGVKVLVLGDPAQLPPIGGAGYFTNIERPQVMLEEIHRQAEESPIIRMATEVRNGQKPKIGSYGEGCEYVDFGDSKMPAELALQFDQILVGKNATRFATNRRVRKLKGIEDKYPIAGDRLVCLNNNHDEGLLNGAIYNVMNVMGVMDQKVHMDIVPEDSKRGMSVMAHEQYFLGEEPSWFEKREAECFDFGYALTVHKSQGSQWDSVLLFDESFCFRKDKWKWLYTGITRAAKKITVVRM